jgi:carbohydrate-selective porin OprB
MMEIYLKYLIVARKGRREMHIGYWWESQKERDHWEDVDVGGWTVLKWI